MTDGKKPAPTPIALDGGWGWIALVGSFVAYFIADGWAYSFGVLYTDLLAQFEDGKGKTALIGALLYGVPLLVSPFVCALTNIYGCRFVCIGGGILTGSSFVVSYFADSVNFLCVTTGVLASIGLAMTYIPAIVIVTFYFEKRRGFATGLAVTGSGLGAFAFPPLMEFLIEKYFWQGTLLIFGGIAFNIIVCGALFRPPPMGISPSDENDDMENEVELQEVRIRQGSVIMPCMHTNQSVSQKSSSFDNLECKKPVFQTAPLQLTHLALETEEERKLMADTQRICNQYANIAISCPDLYSQGAQDIQSQETQDSQGETSRTKYCNKLLAETKLILTSMMDRSLANNWCYLIWCACTFILYLWVGIPYVYLVDKVKIYGIELQGAVFLLSIMGIGRTIGQIGFGILVDLPWVNSTITYTIAIGICGLSTLLVPFFDTYPLLAGYCAVFGTFVSVTYALQIMCLVDIVGLEKTTNAFGLFQLVQGIATLLGTPIAGKAESHSDTKWHYKFVVGLQNFFFPPNLMVKKYFYCVLLIQYLQQLHGEVKIEEV